MIRCNKPKRWGLGEASKAGEKPPNTEGKKEMDGRLSDLQAMRAKQDAELFGEPIQDADPLLQKKINHSSHTRKS
jgi:hypothetical protein